MRGLLLLVAGTSVVCAGSIVVAMIAGGRLSPDWTPYFDQIDVCGNELCILGVVPGATSWIEAERLIKPHAQQYSSSQEYGTQDVIVRVDQTLFDLSGPIKANIAGLLVYPEPKLILTIGAMVARFGGPCFVSSPNSSLSGPVLDLYYPFGIAETKPGSYELNIDTPISVLSADETVDNRKCREYPVSNSREFSIFSWYGFRSFHFYSRFP